MKKCLIVTDGKAGHENQSKAFCRALGFDYDLWPVAYPSASRKALAYLADRLGILSDRPFTADPPPGGDYAAVVCTGSTAFYPGKVIARKRGIPVAAILYPKGYRLQQDMLWNKNHKQVSSLSLHNRPLPHGWYNALFH